MPTSSLAPQPKAAGATPLPRLSMSFSLFPTGRKRSCPSLSSACSIPSVLGTGRYSMVLPNFVKSALDNTPISVYGTGKQSRCFCDVRDTVEALIRLMDTNRSIGEVINVGNTEEITIEGLAQRVKERTGSSSPIEYVPYDKAYEPGFEDMMRRVPSVEKLHALTGFRPRTPLNEIIDRVSAFFQQKVESLDIHRVATI